MPTRRFRDGRLLAALAAAAALATALALAGTVSADAGARDGAEAWQSAFAERSGAGDGRRMLVVLAGPSVADRVAGGRASTPAAQRRAAQAADRMQRRLLAVLQARGVKIHREHVFTRTFNGFSAVLGARALAALERFPAVVGVYPVRAVYQAEVATSPAGAPVSSPADLVPGADGSGVTVALLDGAPPPGAAAGALLAPLDVPGAASGGEGDWHAGRMAEVVHGVAPGAAILPISVLASSGGDGAEASGTSDALLAGIERAVDPDGDGDSEDAVGVALVPLVAPYAAFADGPEARAVAGALALGTLVVAAAGNDGPGGAGFGTVGAPAGAPAALAVGAGDLRASLPFAELTVHSGEETLFSGPARLLAEGPTPTASTPVTVLAATGEPLAPRIEQAAADGAGAVLVYGSLLPAGSLELPAGVELPVVAIPAPLGRALLDEEPLVIELRPAIRANPESASVAAFSSGGIVPSGAVKPDVVAPGVGVEAGGAGTATGSSAAAAAAAGAAALVADARPELDAATLRAVLVGTAQPLGAAATAQGAGLVDAAAAAAAAVAVGPSSLAFGRVGASASDATVTVLVRNLGRRPLRLSFRQAADAGPLVSVLARPARATVRPGKAVKVEVTLRVLGRRAGAAVASGSLSVDAGGVTLARVPYAALLAGPRAADLVGDLALSRATVTAPAEDPSILSFRAGWAAEGPGGIALEPVGLLEVELSTAAGKRLGVLTRLRDLLPGTYALALTGRGPDGEPLPPGDYVVRVRALSADAHEGGAGTDSVATAQFSVGRSR